MVNNSDLKFVGTPGSGIDPWLPDSGDIDTPINNTIEKEEPVVDLDEQHAAAEELSQGIRDWWNANVTDGSNMSGFFGAFGIKTDNIDSYISLLDLVRKGDVVTEPKDFMYKENNATGAETRSLVRTLNKNEFPKEPNRDDSFGISNIHKMDNVTYSATPLEDGETWRCRLTSTLEFPDYRSADPGTK